MSINSGIKKISKAESSRGSSLVEISIAIGIGAIIASMLSVVAVQGLESIRSAKRTERLHASGMLIADTVQYWMKQNKSFDAPDDHTLSVVFPDNSVKTLALSGGDLLLDGVPLISDADISVERFYVEKFPRSVEIAFTVRAENYNELLSATTSVADRH